MDNLLTVHFHSMHGDYSRYSMFHVRMILALLVRLLLPPIVLLILSIFWSKRKTGRGKHMITVSDAS